MSYLEKAKRAAAARETSERCEGSPQADPLLSPNSLIAPPGQVTGRADHVGVYRAALFAWWRLTAQGAEADLAAVESTYQSIAMLIDELGEPLATRLRHRFEAEWYQETGRCPRCGEPGARHT